MILEVPSGLIVAQLLITVYRSGRSLTLEQIAQLWLIGLVRTDHGRVADHLIVCGGSLTSQIASRVDRYFSSFIGHISPIANRVC